MSDDPFEDELMKMVGVIPGEQLDLAREAFEFVQSQDPMPPDHVRFAFSSSEGVAVLDVHEFTHPTTFQYLSQEALTDALLEYILKNTETTTLEEDAMAVVLAWELHTRHPPVRGEVRALFAHAAREVGTRNSYGLLFVITTKEPC